MLLLGIIILVMTISLVSLYLLIILIHVKDQFTFLIILYNALLLYNMLYIIPLSTDINILGRLF
jgi:hypothetical protein